MKHEFAHLTGPLVRLECLECGRAYYWQERVKMPLVCTWVACGGKLEKR